MSTENTKPILYNKKIGQELIVLSELILDVYHEVKELTKLTWSSESWREIGFYNKDKITKSSVFFGTWFESWGQFQIPLCIVVDYQGKAPYEKHQQIRKFVETKNIQGVYFKDYLNYAVILFDYDFFNNKKDEIKLVTFFREICVFIGINTLLSIHKS